MDYFF